MPVLGGSSSVARRALVLEPAVSGPEPPVPPPAVAWAVPGSELGPREAKGGSGRSVTASRPGPELRIGVPQSAWGEPSSMPVGESALADPCAPRAGEPRSRGSVLSGASCGEGGDEEYAANEARCWAAASVRASSAASRASQSQHALRCAMGAGSRNQAGKCQARVAQGAEAVLSKMAAAERQKRDARQGRASTGVQGRGVGWGCSRFVIDTGGGDRGAQRGC